MRSRWLPLALLPLLLPLAARADAPDDGWQPGATSRGDGFAYQMFSKESEGESFVRYRAQGSIDARPDALVRAVRLIATDPAYAPDGQTRHRLSSQEGAFVTYTLIDMPPLFTDRDIVTRGVGSVDPVSGARRIDWKTVEHPEAPELPDVIRIREAAGYWSFTPNGDTTDVTYETHLDLGGSLPSWLVQGMMAGMVAKNFEDVARESRAR